MKTKTMILLINVHEENGRKAFRRRKEFPKIIFLPFFPHIK
jgi:hypothetical protein